MQYTRISNICCDLDGPAASAVGPDEFGQLLGQSGAIGNIVVNFATGTTQEAADFVAYMTAPLSRDRYTDPADASYWAELRASDSLVVINASPVDAVHSQVTVDGLLHKSLAHVVVLDEPNPTAYNTPEDPDSVTTVASTAQVGNGEFPWTFPAHSLTMLQLPRQAPEFLAAGPGHAGPRAGTPGNSPAGAQISS
jgi:alpha-L-arabinofuranosidase